MPSGGEPRSVIAKRFGYDTVSHAYRLALRCTEGDRND